MPSSTRAFAPWWFATALLGAAASAEQIGPGALSALPVADVVILGEVHDNPTHHRHQADALASVQPAGVAFEMLTPAQADIVNAWTGGAGLDEALDWAASGWPDWSLYAPVFAALGEARVYGMAVPRTELIAAIEAGAAAAFGPEAARFGLAQPLAAEEQSARESRQAAAHCDKLPAEMLPGFVEAQRLRDARFAQTVLRALTETGGPVAVITGSGHARTDWGMPAVLRAAAPTVAVLSVGQIETGGVPGAPQPFDLWLTAPPAEREDPCAGLSFDRSGG